MDNSSAMSCIEITQDMSVLSLEFKRKSCAVLVVQLINGMFILTTKVSSKMNYLG